MREGLDCVFALACRQLGRGGSLFHSLIRLGSGFLFLDAKNPGQDEGHTGGNAN